MSPRQWINDHPAIVLVTMAGLFIVAGLWALSSMRSRPRLAKPVSTSSYYFDLETGQLFTDKPGLFPPIPAPSGVMQGDEPTGVRAYVFSCTSCEEKATQFVGYLEKYTPQAKVALQGMRPQAGARRSTLSPGGPPPPPGSAPPGGPDDASGIMSPRQAMTVGVLVAVAPAMGQKSTNVEWVPAISDDGVSLKNLAMSKCPDNSPAKPCYP